MRLLLALLLLLGPAFGQPKPPEKKDAPKVILAVPLGIPAGQPTKVILRGLRIDTATAVECLELNGPIEIVRKGKANVPNPLKPEQVGDTEIELKLPTADGAKSKQLRFAVITPAGRTAPHTVFIDGADVVAEKEPNAGFRQAQPVKVGQTVAGTIGGNQDVDCYRFRGEEGQVVLVDLLAARLGSPLDAVLTLTDDAGRILAQADDLPDSRDARLEARLPRSGEYVVTVQDAHDLGSNVHGYRMELRSK